MPVSHLAKRAKIQRIPRDWSLLHFIYNLLYVISHFLEQYCNHCFKWTNSQDTILLHPLYCKNVKQLNPLLYKHLEQRSNVIHPTCCQLIKVFVPQIPQPFTKPWRREEGRGGEGRGGKKGEKKHRTVQTGSTG